MDLTNEGPGAGVGGTRPLRILHVEDDPKDAELVAAKLAAEGIACDVTRVETREAFEAALEQGGFDLIFSDFSLPAFDGLTALTILQTKRLDIPFIVVSGTIGEETAVITLRCGATDYLLKHRLARLGEAVRRALHEREQRGRRQRIEEALRKSEERFALICQTVNDVLWDWDLQTDAVWWNEGFQTRFGEPAEEIGSGIESWRSRLHPADRDRVLGGLEAVLASGRVRWSDEYRFRRADGSFASVLDRGYVIRDARGRPLRMVGTMLDLSEQKELEAQLRQAQKMEAIGQLAGGIAHDFNNLLTVITGYSQLLLEHLQTDEALRTQVEEIKKAGDRAAALTRQLLAFSRQQAVQPRLLDLNAVIRNVAQMLCRLLGERIDLHIHAASDLWPVKADPNQLEQVLMNLAVNARDAMPDGGRLTIATQNVELDRAYACTHPSVNPGPYVRLAVSDSGCGMDEATLARIFEPFFTTKEPGKGTGLGLPTVYGIVKQHGGSIVVSSEPGRGSSFTIYLPRADAPALVPPAEEAAAPSRGTETILLVEDEEAVRRFARTVLEQHGYTVLEAETGAEALRISQAYGAPIHLLVTDLRMRGMSGEELAERLTRLAPAIKVLFMSGYCDRPLPHHGMHDPAAAYLQKPLTPEGLLRRVRAILDETQAPAF
ncbi:response regulator [Nitrospira sp. Kam-Ns4a]